MATFKPAALDAFFIREPGIVRGNFTMMKSLEARLRNSWCWRHGYPSLVSYP